MNSFLRLVPFALAFALAPGYVEAGVVFTKTGQAILGVLVENESSVSLQVPHGAVEYRKETLLWYSTAPEVDSLFAAARKARAETNAVAAAALYELSVAQEPATKEAAYAELETFRAAVADQAAATAATHAPAAASLVTPEDKIAQGKRMMEGGSNVLASTTIDVGLAAQAHATAQKNIAEGARLMAEGQKELADQQAKIAAATAQQQETKAAVAQAAETGWTREERLVNGAVAVFLTLVVLASLHGIIQREPKI
ncbi:MAG: hypothetical protein IT578_08815 [Verrucomicrobiae bacterium]|nr:hypothetical protein [Verrucomicrobiae bacterium]